jgi:hypothetical protein
LCAPGWNLLDVFVVVVSIASTVGADYSGLNSLRAARALRAVRLLRGFTKLREIVNAVLSSVSKCRNSQA